MLQLESGWWGALPIQIARHEYGVVELVYLICPIRSIPLLGSRYRRSVIVSCVPMEESRIACSLPVDHEPFNKQMPRLLPSQATGNVSNPAPPRARAPPRPIRNARMNPRLSFFLSQTALAYARTWRHTDAAGQILGRMATRFVPCFGKNSEEGRRERARGRENGVKKWEGEKEVHDRTIGRCRKGMRKGQRLRNLFQSWNFGGRGRREGNPFEDHQI